jgi:hypothetical protein
MVAKGRSDADSRNMGSRRRRKWSQAWGPGQRERSWIEGRRWARQKGSAYPRAREAVNRCDSVLGHAEDRIPILQMTLESEVLARDVLPEGPKPPV